MASKKRRRHGDKQRSQQPGLPELPDRRAMERVMQQLVGQLHGRESSDSPLDKAQQVMYQAFEERDERRKLDLARKALTICPDCTDAYVLLAEHTRSHKEALELYQKGVEAGERTLGPKPFQEDVGHFWGILETRPYMRARWGLANELWTAGRRVEAVEHLQDMLRLNPGDNQGVRYTLVGYLLCLDRDMEADILLHEFNEASAIWTYTKVLLAFRWYGDTPDVRRLLAIAKKSNKHVPAFLLGQAPLPADQPSYYSPGKESEAMMYAQMFLRCWRNTSGAITWLRQREKKKQTQPQPKGPLGLIKKWLTKNLPQEDDTWQADFRRVPEWMVIGGEKMRPWTILVTSHSHDLVLGHAIVEDSPSANHLWDALAQAMQKPVAGEPHRPTHLEVRSDERWASLKPHLAEVGVEAEMTDDLHHMDDVFAGMHEHLIGKPRPGMLEMPSVTPEQVASFFDAAASFYRQAPWKLVGDDATIKVECIKFESGPWYAVVMGQAGMTLGLVLYEDLRVVRKMQGGELDDEEHARHAVVLSMTFGDDTDLAVKDLEAIERHGWKLASPEAYPSIFKKERGMTIRPPLSWELELMDGCLRAIPQFVKLRKVDEPTPEEIVVPAGTGQLKLILSWVIDGQ